MVYDVQGLILTNNHVIAGARSLTVARGAGQVTGQVTLGAMFLTQPAAWSAPVSTARFGADPQPYLSADSGPPQPATLGCACEIGGASLIMAD